VVCGFVVVVGLALAVADEVTRDEVLVLHRLALVRFFFAKGA